MLGTSLRIVTVLSSKLFVSCVCVLVILDG